jgi:nucleotide-binding universal stress UspA family protein
MPFKDLLVHLDGSAQSAHRLDVAVGLAQRHDAQLTGLYIFDLIPAIESIARSYPDQVQYLESYTKLRKESLDRASSIEKQFRERLRRDGIAGEWRFLESLPAETTALHARYADLTILGQIDTEKLPSGNAARVPEEVLFESGRPVLIVPYAGRFNMVGDNVLVAWKATREAARALNDAMPLLQMAKKVTVLTVNPDRGDDVEPGIPAADIAHHLAHHGVKTEAASTIADEIDTADALLNHVADCGADLLVMGGYGHSRAREFVLGGVTRQILRQMTVPVLMAH